MECLAAGVPLPTDVLDSSWVNHGEIVDEFISAGSESELWSWSHTSDPKGICVALPRWNTADTADLFGIICLGTDSSNACFFDNDNSDFHPRYTVIPFSDFLGGADLDGNGQGECTDCHAGENPFVVHPDKPAFADLLSNGRKTLMTPRTGWYEPIVIGTGAVYGTWSQNPGPDRRLDAVDSENPCTACHEVPIVSTALAGYCNMVLNPAVTRETETMPPLAVVPPGVPYVDVRDRYRNHFETMLGEWCGEAPPAARTEVTVSFADDGMVLSPPAVDRAYTCAQGVTVRGVVPNGEVELFIDTTPHPVTRYADGSDAVGFALSAPLTKGQNLSARQRSGAGPWTAMSASTVVDDYPDPVLPAPVIDPSTVYRCGAAIAVRTVPGAVLTAWNGTVPQTVNTTSGYQRMSPGSAPWDLGDEFTAQASLCGVPSPLSEKVEAVEPPATLNAPRFDPPTPFVGQAYTVLRDLDYGAYGAISRTAPSFLTLGDTCVTAGTVSCRFSLPDSALGRVLQAGENLSAEPSLHCPGGPTGPATTTATALPCADLPAPTVAQPNPGDDFIVVQEMLPAARIRVYDAATSQEIGDGAGSVIRLVGGRTLAAGDVIIVVQQVGTCVGRTGHQLSISTGGGN
jgi:hypothetical protein